MRRLAVLLVIPFALIAQISKQAARNPNGGNPAVAPPPTPPGDLCTVEGQVFDAFNGQPLRKASVSLNIIRMSPGIAPGQTSYSATSDAAGKFSVSGIEPGQYRVNASHTGYLSMQFGARRPDGPGTPLELARSQKMTGVNFRLTPHGIIAGHMLDEDGGPLQGVQIQLLRMTYARGRKQLQQYNGSNSNDLGEYRISGIQPGKYYLCAIYRGRLNIMMMDGNSMVTNGPALEQEDYVPTFYPGVTDIAAALPMELKPGQQLQGINLKLTKVYTVSIKGTVINTTAPPAAPEQLPGRGNVRVNVSVQLEPRNSLNPNGMAQSTGVRPDGNFEFPSIAPGSYKLIAATNTGNLRHAAMLPIDVGNANVEGVNLIINPGVTVAGHIRVDGETTDPIPSFQVRLNAMALGFNVNPSQPVKIDASNTFRFDDVNPDNFDVSVTPLPGTFYLKSIRSGNADILANGLDLSGGGGANVEIVIGVNAPQISGVVQNPTTQQPAAAVTVVLIPQEKERREVSLYYRSASTDQNGNFTLSRVNPGEYKVYAWEEVESGSWFDPDFLKPVESKGASVSVREGTPVAVQVTMIPAGSGN
jgi:protocatechuate 3,4-dioxygenase beta subunit